jgi:hypothetical protein
VDTPSANMENPSATIEITGLFVICCERLTATVVADKSYESDCASTPVGAP